MTLQMTVPTTGLTAARGRPQGFTAGLWHAVQLYRSPSEVDEACELTLCGSLARIDSGVHWPDQAQDACPACLVLSR